MPTSSQLRGAVARDGKAPAFGHLTSQVKDTMYALQPVGLIYASAWVDSGETTRYTAALLYSTSGRPFELRSNTQSLSATVAFVPPLLARSLSACDVGLVSVNVAPGHPLYPELCRRGGDDMQVFDPASFYDMRSQFLRAYQAELSAEQAMQLLHKATERVAELLPGRSGEVSRQNREMHSLVSNNPDLSLDALARLAGLSYDRASHAVREAMGLSLKSYQSWRKMNQVLGMLLDGMSMTEAAHAAGFSDSAHLSRSFRTQLGASPSYMRQLNCVRVIR